MQWRSKNNGGFVEDEVEIQGRNLPEWREKEEKRKMRTRRETAEIGLRKSVGGFLGQQSAFHGTAQPWKGRQPNGSEG